MPITTDAGLIRAAKNAVEIMLRFKGQQIALVPADGTVVAKPSGGHDFVAGAPRDSQLLALSMRSDPEEVFDANDDGAARTRRCLLVGRADALVSVGDTWSDEHANYVVETVDYDSGYKTVATVTAYVKVG